MPSLSDVVTWSDIAWCDYITELKAIFSHYGIPNILVTANGPQFLTAEFAVYE